MSGEALRKDWCSEVGTTSVTHLHLVSDVNEFTTQELMVPTTSSRTRPARRRHESEQLLLAALAMVMALMVASWSCDRVREARVTSLLDVVPVTTHTVRAGESLWSIACDHPVEGVSTQEVVRWLADENGLTNSALALGQSLLVPEEGLAEMTDA